MDIYQIYQNRVNTMRTLIENDAFNLDIFCQYYGIPTSNARTMYRNNFIDMPKKIEEVESQKPASLKNLIKMRDSYLNQFPNDRENALNDLGFWCEPYDVYSFLNTEFNRNNLDSADFFNIKAQTLDSYEEYQKTKEISNYSLFLIDKQKEDVIKVYTSVESPYSCDKEMLCKLLAIPQGALAIIHDIVKYENHDIFKTKHKTEVDDRRQLVWELYHTQDSAHGYTQQEIANIFGVTRNTIISDLKAYSQAHPEKKDSTQLYRPRHLGKEKTDKRNYIKEKVVALFDSGKNNTEIAKELDITIDMTSKLLMEAGKIGTIDNISKKELKQAYKYKNLPYQYKKNKQNINYFHQSSTAYLLDNKNAPAPGEDMFLRNKIRGPLLDAQRANMAIIRNNPELIPLLEKYNGSITKAKKVLKEQSITNEELAI